MRVFSIVSLLLLTACLNGTGPDTVDDEPEPFVCATDRDCGEGSICDKTDDGDDIAAADDTNGVCLVIQCRCGTLPTTCSNERGCEEGRPFACVEDSDCGVGEACRFTDGRARCERPPTFTASQILLSRTVALAGEAVMALPWSDGVDGRFSTSAPFTVVAACDVGVCEQRVAAYGRTALLRVHARASTHQVIVADPLGVPVVGARVRTIVGDTIVDDITDANGVYGYDDDVEFISVAADGFEAHTVAAPAKDLLLIARPLERVVIGTTVHVDPSDISSRGDIRLSIANTPFNGDPASFSLTDVLGPASAVRVTISDLPPSTARSSLSPMARRFRSGRRIFDRVASSSPM